MRGSLVGRALVVVCGVVALGCGGSGGPLDPAPTLDGTWEGFLTENVPQAFFLTLTLEEDGGRVSGEGELRAGGQPLSRFTVRGEVVGTEVDLELVFEQLAPARITGRLRSDPDRIVGTLQGSGFEDVPVELARS